MAGSAGVFGLVIKGVDEARHMVVERSTDCGYDPSEKAAAKARDKGVDLHCPINPFAAACRVVEDQAPVKR